MSDCTTRLSAPSGNVERLATLYGVAEKGELSPFDHPAELQSAGHVFNPAGQTVGLWRLCATIVAKRKMQGLDR